MLEEVLLHIRNWFAVNKSSNTYTIENGVLEYMGLASGQYYRIIGSKFNDGLHQFDDPTDTLIDETFYGAIWELAVPKAVQKIAAEIKTYETQFGNSPYSSESFGGYSYQKGTGRSGNVSTWQDVFASRLNAWRKI